MYSVVDSHFPDRWTVGGMLLLKTKVSLVGVQVIGTLFTKLIYVSYRPSPSYRPRKYCICDSLHRKFVSATFG